MKKIFFSFIFFTAALTQANVVCDKTHLSDASSLKKLADMVMPRVPEKTVKLVILNSQAAMITDKGNVVLVQEYLESREGLIIESNAGPVTIIVPSTGQEIHLERNSKIKIVKQNKSTDAKTCLLSFLVQKGKATFESDHENAQTRCNPVEKNIFEAATKKILIQPKGTKYSVELSQAIAEANGEELDANEEDADEDVSVEKGSIEIKLRKVKKSKLSNKKPKNEALATADYDFESEIRTVKAHGKAKVKKSKNRMAEIQVTNPEAN